MTADDADGYLRDARAWIASRAEFFDRRRRPVLVARAPGRLDVMGGISDYSGSLVLELPLAVATWVAVQAHDPPELPDGGEICFAQGHCYLCDELLAFLEPALGLFGG